MKLIIKINQETQEFWIFRELYFQVNFQVKYNFKNDSNIPTTNQVEVKS